MTLHYADDWLTVYLGDCREVMATMEPESVHCVVTSPPYWGLRDYGTDGQLGLEPTPEQYVENMVAVFREVRRVLRSDGTVWLNLGDSYFGTGKGPTPPTGMHGANGTPYPTQGVYRHSMLKEKDLVGIPWRVAFALQADGWYLRSDIIWSKPNPMPESVTDRPTKAHEYLFLLSKSARYYFDRDAVREPRDPAQIEWREKYGDTIAKWVQRREEGVGRPGANSGLATQENAASRNIRSVWTIATQPYPGAHFATFPPKLVEPCIKAGTSAKGVCPECGAPWERVVDVTPLPRNDARTASTTEQRMGKTPAPEPVRGGNTSPIVTTTGWRQTCDHFARCECHFGTADAVPATVLDPFAGSGTTAMVAQSLSRRAVLIDLNADYLGQVMERNRAIPLGLGGDAA